MIVAVVGAESTGKTTLTHELAAALRADGLDVAVAVEQLRGWCDRHGRTPRRDEQSAIAAAQTANIAVLADAHAVVLADTTALMTAVYSDWGFGDVGLYAAALVDHRCCHLTLLTALDLPWQADGLQRDGPGVRAPVDALLRGALVRGDIDHAVVTGSGPQRCAQALAALRHLLDMPRHSPAGRRLER